MTFEQQLTITLIDKLAIGALILIGGLIGGLWVNRILEELKVKQTAAFQIAKEKLELKQRNLERKLSKFYRPIRLRLEADNAIWRHMLGKYKEDSTSQEFGLAFETTFSLPNHDRIMEIIEHHGHLVGDDPEVMEEINSYTRHVAVYRALRAMDDKRDPVSFGERLGWPKNFYPVIRDRTVALQAEYNSLFMEYDSLLKHPSSI